MIEMSISFMVIAIIVIAVFNGTTLVQNAKSRSRVNEVKAIENYLYMYHASTGHFPKAEQGDQMYFATNCEIWKTLSDNNVISEIKIDSCDVEDQEIINRKKSFPSQDKSLFYTVGYNKNLLRNTIYALSNSETAEPETADILTNISHLPQSTVKKANTASISNRDAYNIDVKSDNGEMTTGRIQSFSANNRTEECSYNNDKGINCIVSFGIGSLLSGDVAGCFLNDLQAEHADYDIIGDPTKTMSIGTSYTGQCKEGYRPNDKNEPVKITCKLSGSYGAWVEENPCRQDAMCNKEDLSFPNTTFTETDSSTGETTSGSSLTGQAREDTEIQGTCDTGYYADNEEGKNIVVFCNKDGKWEHKTKKCSATSSWEEISNMKFMSKGFTNSTLINYGIWYSEEEILLTENTEIQKPNANKLTYTEGTTYQISCPSDSTTKTKQKIVCKDGKWVVDIKDICYGKKEYQFTETAQQFQVPQAVDEVLLKVWGAQGGDNGGLGGYSYGIKNNLKYGDILYVFVGSRPSPSYIHQPSTYSLGGFNGGGFGYRGSTPHDYALYAAGGGGATDIRYNGITYEDRIIVAGGGGGGSDYLNIGSNFTGGFGGGGNSCGGNGFSNIDELAGKAGCQTKGGIGGEFNVSYSTANGNSGILGKGGDGGMGDNFASSGGGGGYYGGGGSATSLYGASAGGGSGYIGGLQNAGGENGIQTGNGKAIICWGEYAEVDKCN